MMKRIGIETADHLSSTWQFYKDGEAGEKAQMKLVRKAS